jgi:superfamily I DNA/RNA helicase
VNGALTGQARRFIEALPASVTMPAGTGKTHLLAAVVTELTTTGTRVLVLTHTNAGVHAIKKRLKQFKAGETARVCTITSFAFEFARAYPHLGQMQVPQLPNWTDSTRYMSAALRVMSSSHIRKVLAASFTHLLVDEYQDCSELQHQVITQLVAAIPLAGVFGDPLQAIFGFADPLVRWDDVQAQFPNHTTPIVPWRWRGHNEALGEWLLGARAKLGAGQVLDLSRDLPAGLAFQISTNRANELINPALLKRPAGETVLVLCGVGKGQVRATAGRLRGVYSAMEEIGGSFMHEQLTVLDSMNPEAYAWWLASIAKKCFTGYADLDAPLLKKLENGSTVSHLIRANLSSTLTALDHVVENRTLASLAESMLRLTQAKEAKLHSHEAWYDMLATVRNRHLAPVGRFLLAEDDPARSTQPGPLVEELAKVRDHQRHTGRPERSRVVSRTVLVKGLEYDHVIVANVGQISDSCNLYVALTRARKSLLIIGSTPMIAVKATARGPRLVT